MARPREFNEGAVLDAAIRCFWTRGFAATSVRDLAREMGLTGASLYNAFGDKRALYRAALDRYIEQSFAERAARLEASLPPRQAIAAFLREIVERSLGDVERKGCMLVNTALELAPHDLSFRKVVAGVIGQMEAFFRRCAAAGQRDGTISIAQSPEDLGRLLLGIVLGIRVLARSRPERELLEGLLRPAFALLDPGGVAGVGMR